MLSQLKIGCSSYYGLHPIFYTYLILQQPIYYPIVGVDHAAVEGQDDFFVIVLQRPYCLTGTNLAEVILNVLFPVIGVSE